MCIHSHAFPNGVILRSPLLYHTHVPKYFHIYNVVSPIHCYTRYSEQHAFCTLLFIIFKLPSRFYIYKNISALLCIPLTTHVSKLITWTENIILLYSNFTFGIPPVTQTLYQSHSLHIYIPAATQHDLSTIQTGTPSHSFTTPISSLVFKGILTPMFLFFYTRLFEAYDSHLIIPVFAYKTRTLPMFYPCLQNYSTATIPHSVYKTIFHYSYSRLQNYLNPIIPGSFTKQF